MSRILVVPMYVDALVLETAEQVVQAFTDFSRLPYFDKVHTQHANLPYISENILLKPFAEPGLTLEPGIHLHWALPDALTKAVQEPDGRFEFPAVPNRWLVTRTWKGLRQQWVIESDYLTGKQPLSGQRPTVPYPDSIPPYRYLGRCLPLVDWLTEKTKAQNTYLEKLTAMGFDDPAFAAFYPNAHSVFGFHDNNWNQLNQWGSLDKLLGDLNNVTYEVLGWYADPRQDYLAQWVQRYKNTNQGKLSVEEQTSALKALNGWKFHNDSRNILEQMACYGRIRFNAPAAAGGRPQLKASSIKCETAELAVGSTTTEALSAYLASKVDHPQGKDGLENLLEALHLAPSLGRQPIDLGPRFIEARHAKGFRPVSAGSLWTLKTENQPEPWRAGGVDAAGGSQPQFAVPVELAALLNELNDSQQAYDRAVFELESLQQQLFSDWYLFMLCAYPALELPAQYPKSAEIKQFIEQHDLPALSQKLAAVGALVYETRDAAGQPVLVGRPANTLAARVASAANALLDSGAICSLQLLTEADIQDWDGWFTELNQSGFIPLAASWLSAKTPEAKKARNAELLAELNRRMALPDFKRHFIEHRSDLLNPALEVLRELDQPTSAPKHVYTRLNRLLLERLYPKHIAHRPALILQDIHAPRYWEPEDPAVLLAGSVVRPTRRYGAQGDFHHDGLLECSVMPLRGVGPGINSAQDALRQIDDLLRKVPKILLLPPRPGFNEINAALRLLRNMPGLSIWNEPTYTLTNPDLSPIRKAIEQLKTPLSHSSVDLWQAIRKLETAQAYWNPAAQHLADVCEASRSLDEVFGRQTWTEQPWNPILLEWEVEFDPEYQQNFTAGPFRLLENAPDFSQFPAASTDNLKARCYSGRCILTPHAKDQLLQVLAAYLQNVTPAEAGGLDKVQKFLEETHVLAQSLSGFNQALLMQQQTFQLPIRDPATSERRLFTQRVSDLVGEISRAAPQPGSAFTPIRAGRMKINRLRLIDTFGQVQILAITNPVASAKAMPLDGQGIRLNPRLAQPARLNFRWLAANVAPGGTEDVEMNDHQATSPVCGWILINPLDRSLMFYEQNGSALGTIGPAGGWQTAPQNKLTAVNDIRNPHLRKLASHLSNKDEVFLSHFLLAIENALENIYPENTTTNDSLAVLLGRPIAVVRASLNLELRGRPAVNLEWPDFQQDLRQTAVRPDAQGINHRVRSTDGFTTVDFPIRVGEYTQLNDGLIGYWLEDSQGYAGGTFYAPQVAATGAANHPGIRTHQPGKPAMIQQSIDDQPLKLTMLLDPRSTVHATCGVLPVKSIQIPPEQFAEALANIEMTYLAAPILTSAGKIELPLPEEPGYQWSWLEKARDPSKDSTQPNSDITPANQQAGFAGPQELREGWLRLRKSAPDNGDGKQEKTA